MASQEKAGGVNDERMKIGVACEQPLHHQLSSRFIGMAFDVARSESTPFKIYTPANSTCQLSVSVKCSQC